MIMMKTKTHHYNDNNIIYNTNFNNTYTNNDHNYIKNDMAHSRESETVLISRKKISFFI